LRERLLRMRTVDDEVPLVPQGGEPAVEGKAGRRLEPRALLDLDATPAPLGIGVVAVDEIAGGRVLLVSVQGTVAGVALPDRIPGVRWPDELPGLARCPPVIDGRDLRSEERRVGNEWGTGKA